MPSLSNSNTEPGHPPLALPGQEQQRIPASIGPFKILELISGGMALVYKAEQSSPQRLVALKIPRGGKLLSSESRERFLREVRLASSLDHAGIVPVLDAGEIDGTPYYTMPFIEGLPLDRHIETLKPETADRIQIFLRLCDVVQALHEKNLIHRDLKPANVLVDRYGDVRLLDFGLARAMEESTAISLDHSLMGTLQYMAPEQTLPGGKGALTPATDVYSLGVVLYGLLTDTLPYDVQGPKEGVLASIRELEIDRPSSRTATSVRYDAVVLRALGKKPDGRFQNAGEFADAVRRVEFSEAVAPLDSTKVIVWRVRDFVILGLLLGLLVFLLVVLLQEYRSPKVPNLPLMRRNPPISSIHSVR
jgi:serine/threonine protein kinase